MKRIISLLLALLMAFALCGCATTSDGIPTKGVPLGGGSTVKETPYITGTYTSVQMMDGNGDYYDVEGLATVTFTKNKVKLNLDGENYVTETYTFTGVDEDGWYCFIGDDSGASYFYIPDTNVIIVTDHETISIAFA